jgi:hypothetical protein
MAPPKSGLRPGAKTPAHPLSEAGRKLARSLHGGASPSAADAQLRASYRGTPKQESGAATPGSVRRTPSVTPVRMPAPVRKAAPPAAAAAGKAGSGGGTITDDLLNI